MTHITFIWGFMCVTQGKTRSEVRRLYSASSGHSRSVRISRTCSFSFSGTCAKVFLPLTIKVAYTTATSFTPFASRIRIFSKRSSKQFLDLGTQFFRNLINGFQSFPDQFGIDFCHIRSPLLTVQSVRTRRKAQAAFPSSAYQETHSLQPCAGCIRPCHTEAG